MGERGGVGERGRQERAWPGGTREQLGFDSEKETGGETQDMRGEKVTSTL